MDYEQKYIHALERARELKNKLEKSCSLATPTGIESIFPELKESEDEKMLNQVKQSLYRYQDHLIGSPLADDVEMEINWLKSLKPQPHWKPTEEQMNALSMAYKDSLTSGENLITQTETLKSLYNDLKKTLRYDKRRETSFTNRMC